MNKPKVRIVDVETNEIIDREMNDAELAQHLIDVKLEEDKLKKEQEKIMAKNLLLEKLGITEEEAKLLLS